MGVARCSLCSSVSEIECDEFTVASNRPQANSERLCLFFAEYNGHHVPSNSPQAWFCTYQFLLQRGRCKTLHNKVYYSIYCLQYQS